VDARTFIGWTCITCALAGGLPTLRESIGGSEKVAWIPHTVQVEHVPHPPPAYFSPIMYVSNMSDAGSGTQFIKPFGIASAESVGSPRVDGGTKA